MLVMRTSSTPDNDLGLRGIVPSAIKVGICRCDPAHLLVRRDNAPNQEDSRTTDLGFEY